ncbi:transposase [Neobacillus niacini]|uniref:transposase n=1 Tax=Neobacillus niacini TaxID=86668 RepID=UPI0021CB0E4D|nr:transposase [Neobacillus niacini]MCM3763555.1 transposase [Neobacillus niacini]
MVRSVRLWFEGAKFHVTSRGIRRSQLFFEDEDFGMYLILLQETQSRYPFFLHSYCLMSNHTHLQLQTLETPLSTIMKHLNTKYAKYFNRKYDFSGHVFEKRYGAELLNSPEYEIDVSKYIHLNPVAAGMVDTPEDYPWSSYRAYAFAENKVDSRPNSGPNPLVDPRPILSYFPEPPTETYRHYMRSRYTDKFYWEDGKIYFIEGERSSCGQR